MMCMIWSGSHQYLFLCGNIESGGRDTSWIKVFLLLMEDLNTAASLIKTVQCPGREKCISTKKIISNVCNYKIIEKCTGMNVAAIIDH